MLHLLGYVWRLILTDSRLLVTASSLHCKLTFFMYITAKSIWIRYLHIICVYVLICGFEAFHKRLAPWLIENPVKVIEVHLIFFFVIQFLWP